MNRETDVAGETLRHAFAAGSADAVPAADCPPADRLWEAARGLVGGGDVRELIEHVAVCGACAEAWRLARELEPAESAGEARPAPVWWRQPAWAAIAAAALVVLVVGLNWSPPAEGPEDAVRGGGREEALRTPADGGGLSRRDPVLTWPATAGATYDLWIHYEDLEPLIDEYDLETASYRIPDEVLRRVPDGATLLWRVEVKVAGEVSSLATYRLIVDS